MGIGNIILILVVLGGGVALLYFKLTHKKKSAETEDNEVFTYEEESNAHTLDNLTKEIKQVFSQQIRTNLKEENLSLRNYEQRRMDKQKLEASLDRAPYGDVKARKDIKNRIKGILTSKDFPYRLNEKDLDELIPFNDISKLSYREIHEILLYIYERSEKGADGYVEMINEFKLAKKVPGSDGRTYYKITKEMLMDVLLKVTSGKSVIIKDNYKLGYNDKLEIVTQMIFSQYLGFGAIDSLYHQNLEEIDCGISGIPIGGFNIAVATSGNKEIQYGYQSIWIMHRGLNINLEYLGFTSEADFERVSSNIYRYNAAKVLSQTEGIIVATTPDGSRIAVTRPPAAESWAFFLRKFKPATEAPMLARNIQSKNKWIPICLIRWCVIAEQNMVVTGQTGTGKSTILKSIMRYINTEMNLRILEMTLELSIRYMYPDLNCLTLQQTGSLSTARESNFLKKANVAVTIMGEIAEPEQTVEFVKTCQVNSRFGFATHHATTTPNLVDALAGNFTELGMYKDKNDAVAMVAQVLNIDCHLAFNSGYRHIDFINEVIPYTDVEFPADSEEQRNRTDADKFYMDARKALRDMVAPKKFVVRPMCKWSDVGDVGSDKIYGHFELGKEFFEEGPSERFKAKVKDRLTEAVQKEFEEDMTMLHKAWQETLDWNKAHPTQEPEYTPETAEWIRKILTA